MKIISKPIKTLVLSGLALLIGVFAVVPAFAKETNNSNNTNTTTPNTTDRKSTAGEATCSRVKTLSTSSKDNLSSKQSSLQADFSNRLSNIASRQANVDAQVSADRANATTKFDDKIKSLQAEAGLSTDQLTAIDTFKTAVDSARTARQVAVDGARSAYRTALATQIATHQQKLTTVATTYQTTVTGDFANAVASCTDGNGATTLATLKASVKSARAALSASKTPDGSMAAIKALAATRDAAIKAANDTFKATLQPLIATLKSALKVTDTTAVTTTTPTTTKN